MIPKDTPSGRSISNIPKNSHKSSCPPTRLVASLVCSDTDWNSKKSTNHCVRTDRLEASRKYLFGSVGVLGEANASLIEGVLVARGQDILPVVNVAPDYESYTYEKIDLNNPEQKAYFEGALAWDLEVNGKKWADGKNVRDRDFFLLSLSSLQFRHDLNSSSKQINAIHLCILLGSA